MATPISACFMIERIMKGMPHLKKGIKLLVYTVKLYRQIKVVGTYKAPLFLQKPLISRMPLTQINNESVNSIIESEIAWSKSLWLL